MIKKVVVIVVECMIWYVNWLCWDSVVLFGDGVGVVVLEVLDMLLGLFVIKIGCDSEDCDILYIENFGSDLNKYELIGLLNLLFEGCEIFKCVVKGMSEVCDDVLN